MDFSKLTDAEIGELVTRYPLPEGVADNVLNRKQLASAFSVSENTIDKWISQGMPVREEGKNGRSYEFQASHCWAWRHARLHQERLAQQEADDTAQAMRLALVGGSTGSGIDGLTPSEKREVLMATMAMEDFRRQRGRLMQRSEVVSLVEDLMSLIRDGVSNLPDQLERRAGIKGAAVEQSFEICEQVLISMQETIAEFFDARPERPELDGEKRDIFDA